ncbi:MAG: hypothetical protein E8D43_00010 [Nitrospira sp.]|nr:MAG: hypothetical protein E8D43_00010 [Nitrospira sp.]
METDRRSFFALTFALMFVPPVSPRPKYVNLGEITFSEFLKHCKTATCDFGFSIAPADEELWVDFCKGGIGDRLSSQRIAG